MLVTRYRVNIGSKLESNGAMIVKSGVYATENSENAVGYIESYDDESGYAGISLYGAVEKDELISMGILECDIIVEDF